MKQNLQVVAENIGGIIHLLTGDSEKLGQQIQAGSINKNSLEFLQMGLSSLLSSQEIQENVKQNIQRILQDIHQGDIAVDHWEAVNNDLHRLDVEYLSDEGAKRVKVLLDKGVIEAADLKNLQMVVGAFFNRYQANFSHEVRAHFETILHGNNLSFEDLSHLRDDMHAIKAAMLA